MGILSINDIKSKMSNCLDMLASDLCTDRLYILYLLFVSI